MPELHCRVEHGIAVLTLAAVPLVLRDALAAFKRARCRSAIFVLEGIEPDPSLTKPLLTLRRQVSKKRGRLVLCGLSRETEELLRATWLLGLFEVQPDEARALACLNGHKAPHPEAACRNGVLAAARKNSRKK